MHPDVAAPKITEAHGEVIAVVERLGVVDEELATLVAGGGPEVDRVVNAKALAALAKAVEELYETKTTKKSAASKTKKS